MVEDAKIEKKSAPVAAEPAPVAPVEKVITPLLDRHFSQREIKQNEWFATIPKQSSLDDIMVPKFWAYIAAKLQPGSKIVAMAEDLSFYVELIVIARGNNWAEVLPLHKPVQPGKNVLHKNAASEYVIEYGGLIAEWQVVRKADGKVVKGDGTLKTEDQAKEWLRNYLLVVTKAA